MVDAIGPQAFFQNFDALAQQFADIITKYAQSSVQHTFTISINIDREVEPFLRKKLISLGFSGIEFHFDQKDGNYLEIKGNPFAAENAEREANAYVDKINQGLNRATMSGNKVHVHIDVPFALQNAVRSKFTAPGKWSNMEFHSDQKDGSYVTLTV